jgi:hypothetical protein
MDQQNNPAQFEQAATDNMENNMENAVRNRLNLEWIDSEWFQVWLKLARGEDQQE